MKNILLWAVLFLASSCEAQKTTIEDETIAILNLVLSGFNEPICLEEETYFKHPVVNPDFLIGHYFRVYNSSKESAAYKFFFKKIDGVITYDELEKLKEKNLEWEKKKWKTSEILNRKETIIVGSNSESNCINKKQLKISEPVFTNDMKRAMILISTSKHKTGSTYIKVLEKVKGTWVIKGGIPIGTSG